MQAFTTYRDDLVMCFYMRTYNIDKNSVDIRIDKFLISF